MGAHTSAYRSLGTNTSAHMGAQTSTHTRAQANLSAHISAHISFGAHTSSGRIQAHLRALIYVRFFAPGAYLEYNAETMALFSMYWFGKTAQKGTFLQFHPAYSDIQLG